MRKRYLLACALLCTATGGEAAQKNEAEPLRDKNGEPVQAGVFTSRWGRLFSGYTHPLGSWLTAANISTTRHPTYRKSKIPTDLQETLL